MLPYLFLEVCELVGLYVLEKLSKEFGKDKVGFYRDDALMLLNITGGRQENREVEHCTESFGN